MFCFIAIVLSYFCVGIALNFLSTPIIYYVIDTLDASSGLVIEIIHHFISIFFLFFVCLLKSSTECDNDHDDAPLVVQTLLWAIEVMISVVVLC